MNYRFSAGIVYNNYPWPLAATAKQRQAIEEAAQAVLDVRVKYPVSSLADHLYGTMPPDLVEAHQKELSPNLGDGRLGQAAALV